jgi:hypothetical protein
VFPGGRRKKRLRNSRSGTASFGKTPGRGFASTGSAYRGCFCNANNFTGNVASSVVGGETLLECKHWMLQRFHKTDNMGVGVVCPAPPLSITRRPAICWNLTVFNLTPSPVSGMLQPRLRCFAGGLASTTQPLLLRSTSETRRRIEPGRRQDDHNVWKGCGRAAASEARRFFEGDQRTTPKNRCVPKDHSLSGVDRADLRPWLPAGL